MLVRLTSERGRFSSLYLVLTILQLLCVSFPNRCFVDNLFSLRDPTVVPFFVYAAIVVHLGLHFFPLLSFFLHMFRSCRRRRYLSLLFLFRSPVSAMFTLFRARFLPSALCLGYSQNSLLLLLGPPDLCIAVCIDPSIR